MYASMKIQYKLLAHLTSCFLNFSQIEYLINNMKNQLFISLCQIVLLINYMNLFESQINMKSFIQLYT